MPDFVCQTAAKSGFLHCEWKIVHQIEEYSILPMGFTVYTIINIKPLRNRRDKAKQLFCNIMQSLI